MDIVGIPRPIPRSYLQEDSAAVFGLSNIGWRQPGGAVLSNSSTAGTFFVEGLGSNQWYFRGVDAQGNTKADVMWGTFTLPVDYVAGEAISLRATVGVAGSGTAGTCTVDFSIYKQAADASVGSDLVSTAATAITSTYGNKDFVVTPTGLAPGDRLNIKLTTSVQETGGAAILVALVTDVSILLDVKG